MKVLLMYADKDFDHESELPPNHQDLASDLGLDTVWNQMAQGDGFVREVARHATLEMLNDPAEIGYRQDILRDCLNHASVVRELYGIAVEAMEREKREYFGLFSHSPTTILRRSLKVMQIFVELLKKLKRISVAHSRLFVSAGFNRFFAMIDEDLGEEYFAHVEHQLQELQFRHGIRISAQLGKGNKGVHYVLHKSRQESRSWFQRLTQKAEPGYTIVIAERDDAGFRALAELQDQGTNLVANALAQAVDHVLGFFVRMRTEVAFYMGCINLRDELVRKGTSICFPEALSPSPRHFTCRGLYDVSLALNLAAPITGNTVHGDGKNLVLITGANQGGKSTFLRSVGLSQLMMQCGMFVPAEEYRASVCYGVFTHYRREEDASMTHGKLDEELHRMSQLADRLRMHSLVLFNESFAATNEREGSEIARQIIDALLEQQVAVFFVTHAYTLARGYYDRRLDSQLFLRAERKQDGTRTFKLIEGEPLETSYGEDLYREIFESAVPGEWAGLKKANNKG